MAVIGTFRGLDGNGKLPSTAKNDIATDITTPASTVRQALDAAGLGKGASDADIAAMVQNRATTTGAALASTFVDTTGPAESQALAKEADAGALNIVGTGMSLMYGYDASSTTTQAELPGRFGTRSVTPPLDVFRDALGKVVRNAALTVTNQAYAGDQSDVGSGNALTRWAGGTSGDIELLWVDTNDAINAGQFATGRLTAAQSASGLRKLIVRAIARGSQPVVMGGAPVLDGANSRRIKAFAEGHRRMAERFGVPYVDVPELLRGLPRSGSFIWTATDGTHFKPEAYAIIGARLAALFGPHGVHPREVAPGSILRPLERQHIGGVVTARTNGGPSGVFDGRVLRLVAGETVSYPVNALVPVTPVFEFAQVSGTEGRGTGSIAYADEKAGVQSIPVDTNSMNLGVNYVLGHVLDAGPHLVTVKCVTGTLEIGSVRFTSADGSRLQGGRINGDLAGKMQQRRSTMAGATIRGNTTTRAYHAVYDEHTPVNLLKPGGGRAAARVDFQLDLPEGTSTSTLVGCALGAGLASDLGSYVSRTGFFIFRPGATSADRLIIRPMNGDAPGTDISVAGVFPATGRWRGTITAEFTTAGDMNIRVDGAIKATVLAANQPHRHFVPLVVANITEDEMVSCQGIAVTDATATLA